MKKCRFFLVLFLCCWMLVFSSLPAAAWSLPGEADDVEEETSADLVSPFAVLSPNSQALPVPQEFSYPTDGFQSQAKAAMLIELNSNSLVYSLNPDMKVYPASLTKIMTCILALEYGNLDDLITVTDTAMSDLSIYGSTANLEVGEQMTLENILYCMMLSSANEACNVIAEHFCNDIDVFVQRMNEKAAALGCTGTHFANTHGLHDENHYTTARDLSIIARYAWQNPDFRRITSTAEYIVPATNCSEPRELSSTNYMIHSDYSKYYYSKAAGIKTGFTTPAGGCLISTAKDGNMEFLSVVCGCAEELQDDGSYTDIRFTTTKDMFEYGFSHFTYAQVLTPLQMVADVPVSMAAGRDDVVLTPAQECFTLLPVPFVPEQVTFSYTLTDSSLQAPIAQNQVVGTVSALYQGNVVATTDLCAAFAVDRSSSAYATAETQNFMAQFWWLILLILLIFAIIAVLWTRRTIKLRRKKRAAQRARANRRRNAHENRKP